MSRLLRSPVLRSNAFWIGALAVVLALVLLGHRGIWDPDEGRYTNVALHMLDSGDWIDPHRSTEVGHWTKPPMAYWAIAATVGVFGHNAWAARLPAALAYLLCVWLSGRIARRVAPGSETQASLVFATMLFTVGASQLITTDYVLTACETLAMWCFVEARFGPEGLARRWLIGMWAGFALAFLTKGPPGLLPLLAVVAFELMTRGTRRASAFHWTGLLVFVAIALPWYLVVVQRNPGLLQYFLGSEVVGRVASNEFGRHGEWYGWATIYGPTLLLGTLPWTFAILRWARALPASVRGWRTREGRAADAGGLLLALWLFLPLLVFCASRSRLPLYVLPLAVPLAVLAARQRAREGRGLPRWPLFAVFAVLVLAAEFAAAHWSTHKDASAWAREIHARVPGPISQVVIVQDMARYGLHLTLGVEVEKVSIEPEPGARFNPEYDESIADEIGKDFDGNALWLTKQERWEATRAKLASLGVVAVPQGTPYQGRVLFRVRLAGR
jgi:4-amino-4-deoxy-L-arabinose transferase-like glycosyltransferase